MKASLRAPLALLLATFTLPAAAQATRPAPTVPSASGGAIVGTSPQAPPGAVKAQIQDTRILEGISKDPWQMERLGVAAVEKKELGKAREFFEESWKLGELPTAPYNLACLDAREGKADAAFRQLDRAIAAGFDEEATLAKDSDLASLRARPEFARIVEGARNNRVAGDAAVVSEGLFVSPGGAPKAILILLHEVNSDPMSVAGPFMGEAKARGLLVAAPRGPTRSGMKRFGWGSADRALDALKRAMAESRRRAGNVPLPVIVVGAGRGGKLGLEVAARTPGLFSAVGSIGGIFDPGPGGAASVTGLKGCAGLPRSRVGGSSRALQGDAARPGEHGEAGRQAEVGRVARFRRGPPDECGRGGQGDPGRAGPRPESFRPTTAPRKSSR
ncbi:MAG: hypothetical protein IPF66_07475 [Holophagales bacterium]|nr:hypothetical protein [Holophagales bacterium]